MVSKEKKEEYMKSAKIGTFIAFSSPNGRVKSAKILRKSSEDKLFHVVTEYEDEFIVPFSDVLWVKTGSRWPRGVYNLLKGIKNEERTIR